jgi:ADP-ribose pyrophosphatase
MSPIEPWRRVSSRLALSAKTFRVRRDRVALPGGADAPIDYAYLDQPAAVVVLALRDDQQLLMVEQYRYPVGRVTLEFPAGSLSGAEPPADAARRELAEEVGVTAAALQQVGAFHQATSLTTAEVFVFLARGLRAGEPHREATEQMVVRAVPPGDFARLIDDGVIHDAITLACYFLARRFLAAGAAG